MANWNFIAKLMSTLGTTAFGVGFTGMAFRGMKNCGCNNHSIFGGGFNYPSNSFNFDMTNPYAFLNANISPANSVTKTSSISSVRPALSAPPPKGFHSQV